MGFGFYKATPLALSLYFPANDRKPTKRLSISKEIQWKKIGKGGIWTL
jgi:hypothetical protein